MTDPTPIELGEGEALYRAGDLPDEGWEAQAAGDYEWSDPGIFAPNDIVVARRKQWTPKPGDRVMNDSGDKGEVLALHEADYAWVLIDNYGPDTFDLASLSPEQAS